MGYQRVEEMPVYQHFYQLAVDVERATRAFGPDFRWLRNQVLRSSESVCANMTEGFYAQFTTEYRQSLYRCRREGRETSTTHLSYARDVGQLAPEIAEGLQTRYEEGMRQLSLLINSVEGRIRSRGKTKPGTSHVREPAETYAEVIPAHMEDQDQP